MLVLTSYKDSAQIASALTHNAVPFAMRPCYTPNGVIAEFVIVELLDTTKLEMFLKTMRCF